MDNSGTLPFDEAHRLKREGEKNFKPDESAPSGGGILRDHIGNKSGLFGWRHKSADFLTRMTAKGENKSAFRKFRFLADLFDWCVQFQLTGTPTLKFILRVMEWLEESLGKLSGGRIKDRRARYFIVAIAAFFFAIGVAYATGLFSGKPGPCEDPWIRLQHPDCKGISK